MKNINNSLIATISDLRKTYSDGLPFTSKYCLSMSLPNSIRKDLTEEKLNIVCISAEIPQREIKTQKIMYRGRPYIIKGQTNFTDTFKITIQEQGHFQVRKVLEKWFDLCDKIDGGSNENYMIGEVYLSHLDAKGNETYKIQFNDVFITNMGSISLGDKSTDAITYDVTFSYSTHEFIS